MPLCSLVYVLTAVQAGENQQVFFQLQKCFLGKVISPRVEGKGSYFNLINQEFSKLFQSL